MTDEMVLTPGGFRSKWGANFFAVVRSIIGTAARRGIDAYQAVKMVLQPESPNKLATIATLR